MSLLPISPKAIVVVFAIAAVVYVALNFMFKMLGL